MSEVNVVACSSNSSVPSPEPSTIEIFSRAVEAHAFLLEDNGGDVFILFRHRSKKELKMVHYHDFDKTGTLDKITEATIQGLRPVTVITLPFAEEDVLPLVELDDSDEEAIHAYFCPDCGSEYSESPLETVN